jgi:hypothetical protein
LDIPDNKRFIYKKIEYKEIVGINIEHHANFIETFNAKHKIRLIGAHSVKHKPHKPTPHSKHKVKIFRCPDGFETTAEEYAAKNGFSASYAYRVLNKLSQLKTDPPT